MLQLCAMTMYHLMRFSFFERWSSANFFPPNLDHQYLLKMYQYLHNSQTWHKILMASSSLFIGHYWRNLGYIRFLRLLIIDFILCGTRWCTSTWLHSWRYHLIWISAWVSLTALTVASPYGYAHCLCGGGKPRGENPTTFLGTMPPWRQRAIGEGPVPFYILRLFSTFQLYCSRKRQWKCACTHTHCALCQRATLCLSSAGSLA